MVYFREFQSQKDHLEHLKLDLSEKKVTLESELETIVATEKHSANLLKQYQEIFQSKTCAVSKSLLCHNIKK